MSMYSQFTTDKNAETDGIYLDFGDFRVKVRRAGGANKEYTKVLAEITNPYQRALKLGTIGDDQARGFFHEAYAKAIILDWQYKATDVDTGEVDWISGMEDPATGQIVEVSPEVIVATFKMLPDLFLEIQEAASSMRNFRTESDKAAVKN